MAAGARPHVALVQSWNPSSAEPPRLSTRVLKDPSYEAVRRAAYGGRCHNVCIWNGTLQHKKLQAVNDEPFEALAQDVVLQIRAIEAARAPARTPE